MEEGKLPGDYIAGFVDGEGCFALKFRRDVRHDRPGKPVYFYWDIEFAIVLKNDDKDILLGIKDSVGCGSVTGPSKRGLARFTIGDVNDLANRVVPFFEKYPLRANKRHDFELWKEAVSLFHKNQRKASGKTMTSQSMSIRWSGEDLSRLMGIKKEMEEYKGGNRHNWKWLNKENHPRP